MDAEKKPARKRKPKAKPAPPEQLSLEEAAQPQPPGDSLAAAIAQLEQAYGDALRDYLDGYTQRLETLADHNQRLSTIDAEKEETLYAETVTQIISATREYYTYLGKLPEDIRQFFLTAADTIRIEDGAQGSPGNLLDAALPLQIRALPSLRSIRPKKYIMQMDAISNQLPALGEYNRLTVGKQGKQPVQTTVTLDLPEHMKIEGGAELTTYDKSILNGVTSLLESGNMIFSLPMLYHAMTGKKNPSVDDQLAEELQSKLEKMRRMMLSIDLVEENLAHFITTEDGEQLEIQDLAIEGYLLPLNKLSGLVNGKRTDLYQLIQTPPLYAYSKMKRQLASVPLALLNTPLNNNSTTIPLKTYLLQRIEMMRNKHNRIVSRTILFESVYAELGDQDASNTRKMRIRGYTTEILDHFVQQGYIRGFETFKKGRAVAGVNIAL